MEIKNARIKSVTITTEDHGCLSAWIHLDYGGSGQGFGGYALYLPESYSNHSTKSLAGHFIYRVLEVTEVHKWEDLKGKTIRVKADNGGVYAIGHILNDNWFCPEEEWKGM